MNNKQKKAVDKEISDLVEYTKAMFAIELFKRQVEAILSGSYKEPKKPSIWARLFRRWK
jgi:hypothetical protein